MSKSVPILRPKPKPRGKNKKNKKVRVLDKEEYNMDRTPRVRWIWVSKGIITHT